MSQDIVSRIVDTLGEIPDDEAKEVLSLVEVHRRERSKRRLALESLFSHQLEVFAEQGSVADMLHEWFEKQKRTVVDKALAMTIPEGNLPFILVVPPPFLSYHTLASMVRHDNRTGYTRLNVRLITDTVSVPEDPYAIYNIEDGRALQGKSPDDAMNLLKEQNRLGLTAAEVLCLAMHTNVSDISERRFLLVDAVGSCYEHVNAGGVYEVPSLQLGDWRPELTWRLRYNAWSKRGAASCGSR